jgi:hypothetical protein
VHQGKDQFPQIANQIIADIFLVNRAFGAQLNFIGEFALDFAPA